MNVTIIFFRVTLFFESKTVTQGTDNLFRSKVKEIFKSELGFIRVPDMLDGLKKRLNDVSST